eukprot:CAMPEP_0196780514 /NCGR_PEP_ID=MMETSP1104-20130614/7938_1 /TAXON_ID=33652 /ORGANISM="Cafeteria sp., Strain Caron Lab Isolate" /LENGTH=140 /DNA_ID=CAMNT_0042150725 /DNA_START=48 /DNA_END=470 /DNA_ORIENTATION=-
METTRDALRASLSAPATNTTPSPFACNYVIWQHEELVPFPPRILRLRGENVRRESFLNECEELFNILATLGRCLNEEHPALSGIGSCFLCFHGPSRLHVALVSDEYKHDILTAFAAELFVPRFGVRKRARISDIEHDNAH